MQKSCIACRYLVKRSGYRKDDGLILLGKCHRNAPTKDGFPGVSNGCWCGEYKKLEVKFFTWNILKHIKNL